MSRKFRRRHLSNQNVTSSSCDGDKEIINSLHIRETGEYSNRPMDLTDVSQRPGDMNILKAGLLPQVGQMKDVPGAGQVAEVEVDGKIQVFTIQNQDTDYSLVELAPPTTLESSLPSFNRISDQCQIGEESPAPGQQLYNLEVLEPMDTTWHQHQHQQHLQQPSIHQQHFSFQNGSSTIEAKYSYQPDFYLQPQDGLSCEPLPILPYREVDEYPAPPPVAPSDHHNILIQRIPSRGGRRQFVGRTGANRFDDENKREQYKRSACDRERARMKDMNKSYTMLRDRLPNTKPSGKRISKIDSLKLAVKYIMHLKYILSFPADTRIPQEIVQFDPNTEAWNRLPRGARRKDLVACTAAWNEAYNLQFSR